MCQFLPNLTNGWIPISQNVSLGEILLILFPHAASDRPKRDGKRANRSQLELLSGLCIEDLVNILGPNGAEEVEVLQVDRFTRKLKVVRGGSVQEIHVDDICIEEGRSGRLFT